jgi:hypothetical protein
MWQYLPRGSALPAALNIFHLSSLGRDEGANDKKGNSDNNPLRRAMKIGRNKPCPCGSGKKYKKGCLNKENVSSDLLHRRSGDAVPDADKKAARIAEIKLLLRHSANPNWTRSTRA